jgi:hypothetical protein
VAEGQVLRRDIVLQELTTIRGMVVARSDGFPIPRARVCVAEGLEYASYLRAEERSTIANDDGTFEFQVALQPGEYYLVPYYDGASWTAAAKTFAETVRLEYGETLETTLELDPPYSIALRVVDRSGAPISNAYVAPTWSMVDISVGFWTGWSTDTDGRFSRNGFAPMGAYSLDIHASGYLPTNSSDYEGRSGEVFPEETIVLYETARAEGLVIDANGDLVAWANLDVQATFEDGREFTFDVDTNGQGYFLTEENLPATTATLDVVIWQDRESSSPPRTWRSDPISFEAGLIHDLGTITLEASDEEE